MTIDTAPAPAPDALDAPPSVMLVSGQLDTEHRLRRAVEAALPGARQIVARHTLEAMRLSFGRRLNLVLIDWQVDGAGGQVLVRHLARWRPDLSAYAFGEGPAPAGGLGQPQPWARLDGTLTQWRRQWLAWTAAHAHSEGAAQ